MNWVTVDSNFIIKSTFNSVTISLVLIYLYYRKKMQLFLWLSIVFLLDCAILNMSIAYYIKFITFIVMIVISLIVNRHEINNLEKSGEKAATVFKIDNIDKAVISSAIVVYLLVRIFVINK